MTATASGGLPGLGAGEGNLGNLFGSGTDLVFGMLAEEWGLIIAVLAVFCIITLSIFAFRAIAAGRSTYYSIAACSTATLFVFQTTLNVLGSVDILPLTGVTFPFLSSGGTSMIASWGLLAFLKAADTRQNASFAIRLDRKSEYKDHLADGDFYDPEELFYAVDHGSPEPFDTGTGLSISQEMENDPEFQRFWAEKQKQMKREQKLAERKVRAQQKVQPEQVQPGKANSGKANSEKANSGKSQAKSQSSIDDSARAETRPRRTEPAPKRKAPAKPRPRPVSYQNVDDDAFFRSLDENNGPTIHTYEDADEDQAVTLEDLFGGDNK